MTDSANETIQAVRDTFDAWNTAWNSGDLEGYLAGYWDSDQTRYVSNTRVIRGKAAIAESYRARFPSPEMMGHLTLVELEVEPMGSSDALAFGVVQLIRQADVFNGVFTVHVRHIDGAWLMVSDHTSG
jgi:uncharacterized protein (TIGR02246 family)